MKEDEIQVRIQVRRFVDSWLKIARVREVLTYVLSGDQFEIEYSFEESEHFIIKYFFVQYQ